MVDDSFFATLLLHNNTVNVIIEMLKNDDRKLIDV